MTSQSKPWALSPLISTMPHLVHSRMGKSDIPPNFPPRESLQDDNSQLAEAVKDLNERKNLSSQLAQIKTAHQRRTHFANKNARKSITFGPNVCPTECRNLLPMFHVTQPTVLWPLSALGPYYDRFLLRIPRVQSRTCPQNSRRNIL